MAGAEDAAPRSNELDINAKVAQLNMKTATVKNVIRIFGEPIKYGWGRKTFTKNNLPSTYILDYPNGFSVVMSKGRVSELRHTQPGYIWQGKLQVGSSLEEVLEAVGRPTETIEGQSCAYKDGVLYKDIDGKKGYCYYGHKKKGVRFFFMDYKVSALYVSRNDFSERRRSRDEGKTSPAADSQGSEIAKAAEDFVQKLADGAFFEATEDFDAAMQDAAPPVKLGQIWDSLVGQHGRFKKITGTREEKFFGYDSAFVSCEFEKSVVDLKVVFNAGKQIAGFFIDQVRPTAGLKSPSHIKPDSFREKEVQIGTGQWVLPGTLAMPVGEGPFPAVVLVHGSGPHDRDETIGANKPFRDIAQGLASQGIAALRYEKRTKQHASKLASVKHLTVKEESIDDALAAAALLRKTQKIDKKRVFILGHSLGGTLAPRIAKADSEIAGLIILAGSAMPLEDVIFEQFFYIFLLDGTISPAEQTQLEKLDKQVAKVKGPGLSSDTPAAQLPLGLPASYWLDLRGYNPAELAKSLSQPMLVLQGERDYCVTLADFGIWKKTLGGRKDVTFKLYPKLNHLFIAGEGKSTPAELQRPGNVEKVIIRDIADWIKNFQ